MGWDGSGTVDERQTGDRYSASDAVSGDGDVTKRGCEIWRSGYVMRNTPTTAAPLVSHSATAAENWMRQLGRDGTKLFCFGHALLRANQNSVSIRLLFLPKMPISRKNVRNTPGLPKVK